MEKPLTMPKLGMTMTEGTVLRWLYNEGDLIEKDEPFIEVMTDKVNMEVEAPFSGRLKQILAQVDETVPIGTPLAIVTDDTLEELPLVETEVTSSSSPVSSISPIPPAPPVPSIHLNSTQPVPSTPAAKREAALHGVSLQVVLQTGAVAPLDKADVVAFVQRQNTLNAPTLQPDNTHTNGYKNTVRATPVAQKMAQEHQLDLAVLAERKAGEKVTRADVEAHIAAGQKQNGVVLEQAPKREETFSAAIAEINEEDQDSTRIPLSPVRRLIGQRMQRSITTAPHIYLDMEIDMTEAERCRLRIGQSLQKQDEAAPSLTAVIVRAVAAALVAHPDVNAAFEEGVAKGKDAIRQWHDVHIGIAVDTEKALLTPVLRNAHQQTIPAIARELRRLTTAARQGTLTPEEMANATFTISNLGMYGIDTFHAIIAPGQSAILAVGKVTKRGVVVEDNQGERLEIRPIMKVSLSADHRILDGASGSRFLHRVKTFLEDPYLLL